jgi:hypothetical protein
MTPDDVVSGFSTGEESAATKDGVGIECRSLTRERQNIREDTFAGEGNRTLKMSRAARV